MPEKGFYSFSIASVPGVRKHKCLFLYCLAVWICSSSSLCLTKLHSSGRMDGHCLVSGNSGVPCGQQTDFWPQKVVGCSWELWAFGEGPMDSSDPGLLFSLFARVCQCQVKSRSNLFDSGLVAEPHHPFPWESWPAAILLCARALWGYWFCASVTQWIREELPWATGLQKETHVWVNVTPNGSLFILWQGFCSASLRHFFWRYS